MPHLAHKPHARRTQRIVLWKLELRGENAALEGCALRSLDERFPDEDVVFGDGPRGDAVRGVGCEGAVFLEEAAGGERCGHGLGTTKEGEL